MTAKKDTPISGLVIPEGVDDNEFSLADLEDGRSKYTAQQKLDAVMAYIIEGSSRKASRVCGIPDDTIRWWMSQSAWWPETMTYLRKQKNDQLDAHITRIADKALEEIEDRIVNGDEVLTPTGTKRKKVSAKDMAVSFAVLFDKRSLLRGEATSIRETRDQNEVIEDVMKKFEQISQEINSKLDRKIVSEQ